MTFSENGADPFLRDADGRNSLHKAVEGGKAEVVEYLLENQSDGVGLAAVPDDRGRTAKELTTPDRRDIIQLFEKYGS